jgi:class 3 adenylate cyclase
VRAEGGAVVKTIGDAVMAAFTTPQAAARAARHIARADLGELSVRLSLHTGPCIAVNLDTGLDYFGRVVNEAAKLQAAADAGQVALRAELAERLGLEGRPATYRYGPHTHDAIVWTPTSDGTPAGVRRQLEA